ncbi:MAG: hypothetical protein ACREPK_12810 [Rhodanobacteraceae bacterium]
MNGPAHRLSWYWLGAITVLVLLAGPWRLALGAQCPKLLMFDGVDIRTQTNPQQAEYWGRKVGVEGFFLNFVMAHWKKDVGTDPNSELWQKVSRFQSLYSKDGVTDNFIKVALYKTHHWKDAQANRAVVARFRHAAMLARHAGLKGIALDLEPYKPTWGGPAGGPDLAPTVEREGRAIGAAMHSAYPDMTLIVLPDVLAATHRYDTLVQRFKSNVHRIKSGKRPPPYDKYGLSVPFVRGLLSIPWKHAVIAMEQTYSRNSDGITRTVQRVRGHYAELLGDKHLQEIGFSTAPGLWTLGKTRKDKAAREKPARFKRRLEASLHAAKQYVWIYGKDSAWQTDGPYASGPVVADFDTYLDVIHQAETSCKASGGTGAGSEQRH